MDNQNSTAPSTDGSRALGLVHRSTLLSRNHPRWGRVSLLRDPQFDEALRYSLKTSNQRCTRNCYYGLSQGSPALAV